MISLASTFEVAHASVAPGGDEVFEDEMAGCLPSSTAYCDGLRLPLRRQVSIGHIRGGVGRTGCSCRLVTSFCRFSLPTAAGRFQRIHLWDHCGSSSGSCGIGDWPASRRGLASISPGAAAARGRALLPWIAIVGRVGVAHSARRTWPWRARRAVVVHPRCGRDGACLLVALVARRRQVDLVRQ